MSRAVETNRHHYLRLKPNSAPRFIIHVIHGKCKEHFTHPILPDALIYFTMLLLFPLHRSLWIFSFRLCYDFFLPFCHVMNQILIHVLFALFIPDCVEYIGVDLIVYIWCTVFFCFFCDWRRQQKANMSQSHSTSETNVGDSAVAGDRRAAECCQIDKTTAWFIRRRVNELNRTVVFKLIIFQRGAEASPADVNVSNSHFVQVTSVFFVMCEFGTCLLRCFFLFFFCRTHSGYSCLSIDSDWPLYFRH